MNLGTALGTAPRKHPGTTLGTVTPVSALTCDGTTFGTGRNRREGNWAVSLLSIEGTVPAPPPTGLSWESAESQLRVRVGAPW